MKRTIPKLGTVIVFASMLFANVSIAADISVSVPVTEMKYMEIGIGPIKVAPGYGDMSKGAHSDFVKIPGGFNSPPHTHTENYYGVVVSGVVSNGQVNAHDIPLPPGSYWFQRGQETHVTKCLSSTECVFFVTQPGAFDFLMTK